MSGLTPTRPITRLTAQEIWPGLARSWVLFVVATVIGGAALAGSWFALGKPEAGAWTSLAPFSIGGHALAAGLLLLIVSDGLLLRRAFAQLENMTPHSAGWGAFARRRCHDIAGSSFVTSMCRQEYDFSGRDWLQSLHGRRKFALILAAFLLLPGTWAVLLSITPAAARDMPLIKLTLPIFLGLAEALLVSLLLIYQEECWHRLIDRWKERSIELDDLIRPIPVPEPSPISKTAEMSVAAGPPRLPLFPVVVVPREPGDDPVTYPAAPAFANDPYAANGPLTSPSADPPSEAWQTVSREPGD